MFTLISKLVHRWRENRLMFKTKGKGLKILGFPIYCFNHNVSIGENVTLYPNISFLGEGNIVIRDNVKIGNNVIIYASKGSSIEIGCKTIIAANSYIIDCNHNIMKSRYIQEQGLSSAPIKIGTDVWIGASCIIAKGAYISDGVVIGANSFVNTLIPEYSIAVGNPAKVIKIRE